MAATHCWATIGVHGDGSCAELRQHIHCRNCAVYAHAGSALLHRPLPADYRQSWAIHFARERERRILSSGSALPFRVNNEWLALPTECFSEITERRAIHSVPHSAPMILGLANVRGELLICISLAHVLSIPSAQTVDLRAEYERMLVVSWKGQRFGFPVDEVKGPQKFYSHQVKAPPTMLARCNPAFCESVLHWPETSAVLLNVDVLFAALSRSFE